MVAHVVKPQTQSSRRDDDPNASDVTSIQVTHRTRGWPVVDVFDDNEADTTVDAVPFSIEADMGDSKDDTETQRPITATPILNVNENPKAATLIAAPSGPSIPPTPIAGFAPNVSVSVKQPTSPLAASMMDEDVRPSTPFPSTAAARLASLNVTLMLPPVPAKTKMLDRAAALGGTVLMQPAAPKPKAALDKTQLLQPAPQPQPQSAPSSLPPPKSRVHSMFDVAVIENVDGITRYRDALSHGENQEHAMLIMTDFISRNVELDEKLYEHVQEAARKAGGRGASPNTILQIINRELTLTRTQATATCVRVNLAQRTMTVASAGGAAPFVVRANNRYTRATCTPNVVLGTMGSAHFEEHTYPFEAGDMILLASTEWITVLERLFTQPPDLAKSTLSFAMRQERAHPPNGSMLRLTVRNS